MYHSDRPLPLDSKEWATFTTASAPVEDVSSTSSELCAILLAELMILHGIFPGSWPLPDHIDRECSLQLSQLLQVHKSYFDMYCLSGS